MNGAEREQGAHDRAALGGGCVGLGGVCGRYRCLQGWLGGGRAPERFVQRWDVYDRFQALLDDHPDAVVVAVEFQSVFPFQERGKQMH